MPNIVSEEIADLMITTYSINLWADPEELSDLFGSQICATDKAWELPLPCCRQHLSSAGWSSRSCVLLGSFVVTTSGASWAFFIQIFGRNTPLPLPQAVWSIGQGLARRHS